MSYLHIDLARTIDEDRYREAERCRRINEALAVRRKHTAQILTHWLRRLIQQERRVATELDVRALAELS